MKKFLSALLAAMLTLNCVIATAFATEPSTQLSESCQTQVVNVTTEFEVSPHSFGGYGHRVTGTASGSFEVNCLSGAGLGAGITLKSDCGSDGAFSYISVQKPDGSYFANDIYLDGNEEKQFQIWAPQNGTYTIHYITYTPNQTVHLQCWIYG